MTFLYLKESPIALKKWNKWPGTRFPQRCREFKQGSKDTELECLFFKTLETVWTTEGIKSMFSDRFDPPKPLRLRFSSVVPLVLDMVPRMLATKIGLVLWNLWNWSGYEKDLKQSRVKLVLGESLSCRIPCASKRDSSWTKDWNSEENSERDFRLRKARPTRWLMIWSLEHEIWKYWYFGQSILPSLVVCC